jgi:hypothetical protein
MKWEKFIAKNTNPMNELETAYRRRRFIFYNLKDNIVFH